MLLLFVINALFIRLCFDAVTTGTIDANTGLAIGSVIYAVTVTDNENDAITYSMTQNPDSGYLTLGTSMPFRSHNFLFHLFLLLLLLPLFLFFFCRVFLSRCVFVAVCICFIVIIWIVSLFVSVSVSVSLSPCVTDWLYLESVSLSICLSGCVVICIRFSVDVILSISASVSLSVFV